MFSVITIILCVRLAKHLRRAKTGEDLFSEESTSNYGVPLRLFDKFPKLNKKKFSWYVLRKAIQSERNTMTKNMLARPGTGFSTVEVKKSQNSHGSCSAISTKFDFYSPGLKAVYRKRYLL